MRRFKRIKDNKIGFNSEIISFRNIVVREQTPVDEFYFERTVASVSGEEAIAFTDPIRMLFNQQRLSQIGSTAIDSWLDSLKKQLHDPLAEMRSKCSDADLKAIIKSRHIQQPCELMAYVDECNANMDSFNKQVQEYLQAQQQSEDQSDIKQVDNVNT